MPDNDRRSGQRSLACNGRPLTGNRRRWTAQRHTIGSRALGGRHAGGTAHQRCTGRGVWDEHWSLPMHPDGVFREFGTKRGVQIRDNLRGNGGDACEIPGDARIQCAVRGLPGVVPCPCPRRAAQRHARGNGVACGSGRRRRGIPIAAGPRARHNGRPITLLIPLPTEAIRGRFHHRTPVSLPMLWTATRSTEITNPPPDPPPHPPSGGLWYGSAKAQAQQHARHMRRSGEHKTQGTFPPTRPRWAGA